jgi:hypothetical protein
MEVVGGSIPLATTKFLTRCPRLALRSLSVDSRTLFETLSESRMLKFLGSTVGIIFLIGLVVVIVLLNLIF